MVIDNLIVFDEDFPDGLVEELNSSYEQSRNSRPDASDSHTHSINSSSQWTRLVDEPWSSLSDSLRKNALLPSDLAADDRSGDGTMPASSLHMRAARPNSQKTDTQQQYQQRPQHSLVSTPHAASSRNPGETGKEGRGSPGGKNTRRYLLQRDQLPGSRFPFNSTVPLVRQQAAAHAMRGDPLRAHAGAPVGTAADASTAATNKGDAGNRSAVQARHRDAGNNTARTGGSFASPLTPPGQAGSDPDNNSVNTGAKRKAQPEQGYSRLSPASETGQNAKREERDSNWLGTGRNMVVVVLLVSIAIGMGLSLHYQGVQNRNITASLESQIAELHELINLYAASQPLSEDIDDPVKVGSHDGEESHLGSHADKDTQVAETVSAASSNLALLSAGAHILTGYTTPPASAGWWKWSRSFRVDHDCMLRAASSECWPIQRDATVAIGLGQAADVEQVRIDFAGLREPFNFEAYLIHASGAIDLLAHHASGPDFDLIGASNVTQLMLRLSGFSDLCIKSVEIIGKVL